MDHLISPDGIPVLGQNKLTVTMVPGTLAGTFDIQVDTSTFVHGLPLAVQCLLQATMLLIPQAYEQIARAVEAKYNE